MPQRRNALPRGPKTASRAVNPKAVLEALESGPAHSMFENIPAAPPATPEGSAEHHSLAAAFRRRSQLGHLIEAIDAEIDEIVRADICGGQDDSQHVEEYDGTLGVSRDFVAAHQAPVGQLQWLDLEGLFDSPGDSPGDVSGIRWGSGCLISRHMLLTAGHCFDQSGGGWVRPSRQGTVISSAEIASLMKVNFMYQKNALTGAVRSPESYPVAELLEYRQGEVDYAIVRLGRDSQDRVPGDVYGWLQPGAGDLLASGDMLCCIQYPGGEPKKVEAGPVADIRNGRIWYDSLDTHNESSGAPLLGPGGKIVGVHTHGGCLWGANRGASIGAIRSASTRLV